MKKTEPKIESLSATADLLSLSEPGATQNNTLLSMSSHKQENTADVSTRVYFNFSYL